MGRAGPSWRRRRRQIRVWCHEQTPAQRNGFACHPRGPTARRREASGARRRACAARPTRDLSAYGVSRRRRCRPHRRGAGRHQRARRCRIRFQSSACRRGQASARYRRFRQDRPARYRHGSAQGPDRAAALANKMRADLFISIHHDSVPDYLLETWQYEEQQHQFSDRFQGYAIFMSHDNVDRAGSLQFGRLLGKALQARGLQYTPHYTLPLMGNRRRELIDATAGVYRYDQLIVLRNTRMPACCSRPDRSSTGRRSWNWRARNAASSSARPSCPRSRIFAWRGRAGAGIGSARVRRTLMPWRGPAMPIPRLSRVIPSPASHELSHKNFLNPGINHTPARSPGRKPQGL